ncbi:hypothetical protein KSD_90680 [Ktedonobacter sp. SOSP1-85]|nr:hypothetical protein KSD_90680 [Ktedonobacter sp. SOSP1-85]
MHPTTVGVLRQKIGWNAPNLSGVRRQKGWWDAPNHGGGYQKEKLS